MADRETHLAILERFRAANKNFEAIDGAGLERLADCAMDVSFQPNTAIIKQGQTAKTLYLIVRGSVRVLTEGKPEPIEIARLGAGSFFGEMGVLNDEPRTASVVAIDDVRCLAFDKPELMAVLEDYPKVLHALGSVGVVRAGHLADIVGSDSDTPDGSA